MSLVNLLTLQSLALLRHARWLSAFAGRCATARLRLIIVEHFDRLSRDPAAIQRLKQVLEFNRVELMDQKGVYATATDISIASLYNTIYKLQLAGKVRRGHDNAVANGRIPGSYAYGYRPRPGAPCERMIERAKRISCVVSSSSIHQAVQRKISPPISPTKACPRLGPPVIRTRLVAPPGIISASLAIAMAAALSATNCISAKYIGMFAQQFSIRKRRRSRSAAIRKNATSRQKRQAIEFCTVAGCSARSLIRGR